jgi:uncharacterized repeat protein (TIGR03803 family)
MRFSVVRWRPLAPLLAILATLLIGQGSAFARTQDSNVVPLAQLSINPLQDAPRSPRGNLIMATDGNFYFTSTAGGTDNIGAVGRMTPGGLVTTLHSFVRTNTMGNTPFAGVIQASDGNLYGTTYFGTDGGGSVFRLTLAGVFTTLKSFGTNKEDEFFPYTGLVQGPDGHLYGTTLRGGLNDKGTIYRITLDGGTFTRLHDFNGDDGENPEGALVVGPDGNLYGTTLQGGSGSRGTVYRLTTAGVLTSLYSFPSLSEFSTAGIAINETGANPRTALLLAADGNLYGTTYQGGPNGYGTVFRITPAGTLNVFHAFTGPSLGSGYPLAGLTQDVAGNFYGTTERSGGLNRGTAYRLSSTGQFSLLHGFTNSVFDGSVPYVSLLPFNGELYGSSFSDGTANSGALFKLDVGDGVTLPVEITVSPMVVDLGGSATLTWSSPTATSCVTAGAWTDTVGVQGSLVVTPAFPAIYNYALSCTDTAGVLRFAYATLQVRAPPSQPVDGGVSGGGGALSLTLLLLLGGGLVRKLYWRSKTS